MIEIDEMTSIQNGSHHHEDNHPRFCLGALFPPIQKQQNGPEDADEHRERYGQCFNHATKVHFFTQYSNKLCSKACVNPDFCEFENVFLGI
jgi:hypothetical protein